MKHLHLRIMALLLAVLLLAGCGGKKENPPPPLDISLPGRQVGYSFSGEDSPALTLAAESAQAVLDVVNTIPVVYEYADLYQLDLVRERMDFDASVQNHSHSALDAAGQLTATHFLSVVKANNEAYLQENTFGYEPIEEDYLAQLCSFMVTVVNRMTEQYPQIDWQRVYCNLGNLKILYDVGMLSYAQVSSEMVLSVSRNNTQIVLTLKGENSFRDVLIHETMHILQMGCSCEQIENCGRRAGVCCYYEDMTFNAADWTWLVEGSAERQMCALTGGSAVSYQYKMDYICSFTMSLLLREQVQADTMETLCFYSDPGLLFDAFGCQTQQDRDEVIKLMTTMQILQIQPGPFYELYKESYGTDPREDDAALDQLSYELKIPVCTALSKYFYQNLVQYLQAQTMPVSDLFCLLALYEGHLNQHLNYASESKAQINAPFIESYNTMRSALLDALSRDNPDKDVEQLYAQYALLQSEGVLNGAFTALSEEKRTFLAERAQWQAEQKGLDIRVPG